MTSWQAVETRRYIRYIAAGGVVDHHSVFPPCLPGHRLPVGPVSQPGSTVHGRSARLGAGRGERSHRLLHKSGWRLTSTNVLCRAASPMRAAGAGEAQTSWFILAGELLPYRSTPCPVPSSCSCGLPTLLAAAASSLRFVSAGRLPPPHASHSLGECYTKHYVRYWFSLSFPPTQWLFTPSCSFLSSLIGAHL